MKEVKKFIRDNRKFVITICILMIGQAILYWLLKQFQSNPIYINYYLDDKIPFLVHFIYIYNLFYPFCFVAFYFLYKKDDKSYYKAIISGVMGFLICDVIFLSMPTIMYRPIIPEVDWLTNLVVKITFLYDNPPLNCFPSIHCLFCFQVIYSYIFSKQTTKNKIIVIAIALLIIVSTLLVKQHFIYDVIASFLICLMTNSITDLFDLYDKFKNKLNKK